MSTTDRLTASAAAAAKAPIIDVEGLAMNFKVRGTLFKALDGISFKVNRGDFFGIIGESGSGKSTTGKCLIRLYVASGGRAEIDGHLVSSPKIGRRTKRWLRTNVQMVFQDPMASLNPTKNILQIISEPLSINHSASREALKYFKKVNAVSKYFKYEFLARETKLDFEFKMRHYAALTAVLQQYAKDYGAPIPQGTSEQLRHAALVGLDDLVTKVQGLADPIYEYVAAYKGLIQHDFGAYDKREFSAVDLELDKADTALKQATREYKYSRQGIAQEELVKQLKEKLKREKIEFSEAYMKRNRGYARSWLATVSSEVKTLRQGVAYANNDVDGAYYRLKLFVAKLTKGYAKRVARLRRLERVYAETAADEARTNLDAIFEYLFDAYVVKAQEFAAAVGATARLDAIDDVRCIVAVAKLYYSLLKRGEAWKNYELFSTQYTQALALRADKQLFAELSAEKLFENLNQYANNLVALVENGQNGDETLKREHYEHVQARKEEIIDARNAYTDMVKAHANAVNADPNLAFYAQNLHQAQDQFNRAKTARDNEINRFLAADWPNLRAQIEGHKAQVKQAQQQCEAALADVNKTIKAICAETVLRAKAENNRNVAVSPSSLKAEFGLRRKSIDALGFEFDNAVSETATYRRVYTWNAEWTWLLFPRFVSLLKRDAVYKALDSVGLKHEHAYRYPHEFSGGQRQRIVIARALITNPSVIIADEPISALDVSIQAQVINILKDLADKKGITVLFIAHDLSMVNYVCNRVIIMHRGRILEQGDVRSIFSAPVHPYTRSLMLATPKLSRVHVDLSSFDDKFAYDAEWSLSNKPAFQTVPGHDDHLVYGTSGQVGKWVDEAKAQRAAA